MSGSRASASPNNNVSYCIRQEISRFESVHPSIYAIYDLIDQIASSDPLLYEQIRNHVVNIEDSFVNSQEWTVSRYVPDIKLGIVGSIHSGKSALVHRYLTGTYMQDESPEGGRFKKEVVMDGQSFLLLIRDEGGPPDIQFSHWVDGVIFVFSLENEESFRVAYEYYARMAHFRNTAEIPLILVGTQDAISESNPRLIDDSRARKLANDLKRCSYYETCATYGLNVERVFQDACFKIGAPRVPVFATNGSRPTTPQHASRGLYSCVPMSSTNSSVPSPPPPPLPQRDGVPPPPPPARESLGTQTRDKLPVDKRVRRATEVPTTNTGDSEPSDGPSRSPRKSNSYSPGSTPQFSRKVNKSLRAKNTGQTSESLDAVMASLSGSATSQTSMGVPPVHHYSDYNSLFSSRTARDRTSFVHAAEKAEGKDLPTPSSTPTQTRKNWRKSNIFKKGDDDKEKEKKMNGIGVGRTIPIKQGYLYKRSTKALNKDWKKKYVTLTEDAYLTYHPNMHDYMEMVHGKEIDLSRTTVKIPGVPYRQSGTRSSITSNGLLKSHLNDAGKGKPNPGETGTAGDGVTSGVDSTGKTKDTSIKKKHKRARSNTKTNANDGYESDGYEFTLISLDNSQWHFEAISADDRDDWVTCIERAILSSLQLNDSGKTRTGPAVCESGVVQSMKGIAGNHLCADCSKPNPDWASLNLGALVCIECSGVHRQLGTHISRVRSLDLDDWPQECVGVMRCIGNTLANSVWEAAVPVNAGNRRKPEPHASRDEKESWIRAKYERREFLPPVPYPDAPIQQQLIDAIARKDTRQVIICLALAGEAVNASYSGQDPRAALHIAATLGNVVYMQLLLWYNANPNVVDQEGRNAFFYASASHHMDCAEFLRRNGCVEQALPAHYPPVSHHHFPSGPGPTQISQHASAVAAGAVTLPRRRSNTTSRAAPNEIGL